MIGRVYDVDEFELKIKTGKQPCYKQKNGQKLLHGTDRHACVLRRRHGNLRHELGSCELGGK